MGLALTHTGVPVLRQPVPAAALAAVAARGVEADGEGAALAQALPALVHVCRKGEMLGTPVVVVGNPPNSPFWGLGAPAIPPQTAHLTPNHPSHPKPPI